MTTYEEFLSHYGYTPKITTYDSSTPDISDDTFVRILNKESVNNTPENKQRILDMWASQRARREANAKPATYESTTVETFTPFYSPRIGYTGSNISGNFTNTYGWTLGGQSILANAVSPLATPIQNGVVKLNTNFLYGKPFFHTEKPSLHYPYANNYNPGNGIVPFTSLMQFSNNASLRDDQDQGVAPKLTFKQAFAQARKAGLNEFEWNGGKYNTMTAEEVAAKKAEDAAAKKAAVTDTPVEEDNKSNVQGSNITISPEMQDYYKKNFPSNIGSNAGTLSKKTNFGSFGMRAL